MNRLSNSLRYSGLALFSGVMLWLSWPERGWTPLIFIALIPLLWIERQYEREKGLRNHLAVFGWFFLAMVIWNSLTTWWIWNSTREGSIVALALNSVFMAVVWQLFYITKRDHGPVIGYLSLPMYWIGFEYLHLNWEISWPWLTLGNAFSVRTQWIQWYEYTGVLGGSLWVLAVNILLFQVIKNLFSRTLLAKVRRANTVLLGFTALLVIGVPIDISYHLYDHRKDSGEPVKVAVVQPNADPYNEKFNSGDDQQLNKFLRLASTVIDSSTDFVLGPETCIPGGLWEEEIREHVFIEKIRKFLTAYPEVNMITGITSFHKFGPNEKLSLTARKFKDSENHYDVYNSALYLSSGGPPQIYHKSRLVPGVEKMPYPKVFGFLEDLAIELGGTSGSLGIQTERNNFVTKKGVSV
ncbi:MAG: apolipoprotein N-acyltransferase, partial [Bacteroidota bacterium]